LKFVNGKVYPPFLCIRIWCIDLIERPVPSLSLVNEVREQLDNPQVMAHIEEIYKKIIFEGTVRSMGVGFLLLGLFQKGFFHLKTG
jgi:hypothetical protein